MHLNVEIKAKTLSHDPIRNYLLSKNAEFRGTDIQTDTYFIVPNGRLKLRHGNIENALIHYSRDNVAGPKNSQIILFPVNESNTLKHLLSTALNVKAEVVKEREIWFIDNVKFHLDRVDGLGIFVEIEAIDKDGSIGRMKLLELCTFYMNEFGIGHSDLISTSYSDMLIEKQ